MFYLQLLMFFGFVCICFGSLIKERDVNTHHYDELEYRLAREFLETNDRLCVWLAARPFLYVSQCPYARRLVLQMIDTAETNLSLGYIPELWSEQIIALYDLLNDKPPQDTPPQDSSQESFFMGQIL